MIIGREKGIEKEKYFSIKGFVNTTGWLAGNILFGYVFLIILLIIIRQNNSLDYFRQYQSQIFAFLLIPIVLKSFYSISDSYNSSKKAILDKSILVLLNTVGIFILFVSSNTLLSEYEVIYLTTYKQCRGVCLSITKGDIPQHRKPLLTFDSLSESIF